MGPRSSTTAALADDAIGPEGVEIKLELAGAACRNTAKLMLVQRAKCRAFSSAPLLCTRKQPTGLRTRSFSTPVILQPLVLLRREEAGRQWPCGSTIGTRSLWASVV